MADQDNQSVSPSSSGDMAVVGEGTPNATPVSIQVLQNIYHELTGKSEEVSKSYDEAFQVVINDFNQLNFKILQTCEQYQIRASNCAINVFYINDTKETFSSFERFQAFNTGSTSAVESVLLTYNFLIVLPKIAQPQSYTVTVRIASPVAIQRKMNGGMFEVPKILKLMGGARTAVVSIKYVDYAVARNVLNIIDEWFQALPQTRNGVLLKFLRKNTGYIPLLTRYLAGLGVTALIVFNIQHLLPASSSLIDVARFGILAFASMFAAYRVAHHLGRTAEDSLDDFTSLSYICLTDGDKKEIALAKSRNHSALKWGGIKLISGLLVSVVAKLAVYKITGVI